MHDLSLNDSIKQFYGDYYNDDLAEWRYLSAKDKAVNLIRLCHPHPHHTLLDIGAGEGSLLLRLDEDNFSPSMFGVEISQSAVEIILQRGIPSLVECQVFDGYHISYPDNAFDLAALSHVLEHVEFPRRLLYEAGRVASMVFVEVPLEDTLRMPKNYHPGKSGHINFYTPKSIRRLVQTCNFQIVDQVVTHPSVEVYQYRYPRNGWAKHRLKDMALRLFPGYAPLIFSYHSALLFRKAGA
jgi:ubiquinone/menaquinone biosynthesis C-methylase UbiE